MNQDLKTRFEEIAMPHLDSVLRVARSMTRSALEAEDLTQETYTRAFQSFDGFELREYGAKPWLLKILQNAFYSSLKLKRRQPTLLDCVDFDSFEEEIGNAAAEPATAETLNWEHIDDELRIAFEGLLPEFRTVILLWAVEGLSYKEIAVACDCAIGTVMSRLYRARQILGRQLRTYAKQRKLSTERFDS